MFDYKHYVPILKGRQGEYGALETLADLVRDALTPLIEIPPIPLNWEEERPDKTIDAHLQKVGVHLEKSWPSDRPFYVDLLWVSENERMSNGEHPLEFVVRAAREWTLKAIPVVGLLRRDDYVEACRRIHQEDKLGVCLRLQREDFVDFDDIEGQTMALLERVGVNPPSVDLVLDLRSIAPPNQVDADSVIGIIESIPRLRAWRSFALTATSFPPNLIGLPPEEASVLERTEWKLWLEILRRVRELRRRPAFGDYAISHPEPPEVDPRVMRASASVRYTADHTWLVLKGRNLRDNGFGQFHEVSRELIQCPEYSGRAFSWGDSYIERCARQNVGPGNLMTWRKVGTSHHLTFAVRQLASQYGS